MNKNNFNKIKKILLILSFLAIAKPIKKEAIMSKINGNRYQDALLLSGNPQNDELRVGFHTMSGFWSSWWPLRENNYVYDGFPHYSSYWIEPRIDMDSYNFSFLLNYTNKGWATEDYLFLSPKNAFSFVQHSTLWGFNLGQEKSFLLGAGLEHGRGVTKKNNPWLRVGFDKFDFLCVFSEINDFNLERWSGAFKLESESYADGTTYSEYFPNINFSSKNRLGVDWLMYEQNIYKHHLYLNLEFEGEGMDLFSELTGMSLAFYLDKSHLSKIELKYIYSENEEYFPGVFVQAGPVYFAWQSAPEHGMYAVLEGFFQLGFKMDMVVNPQKDFKSLGGKEWVTGLSSGKK
jgi:hypothetical protein